MPNKNGPIMFSKVAVLKSFKMRLHRARMGDGDDPTHFDNLEYTVTQDHTFTPDTPGYGAIIQDYYYRKGKIDLLQSMIDVMRG